MDHKQYFVLNARDIKQMFYPIEERMKRLLTQCESNCKSIVLYDCCREDKIQLEANIVKAQAKLPQTSLTSQVAQDKQKAKK